MASSYSVSTIFNARDRMSPAFQRMGRSALGFGNVLKGILGADIIRSGFRFLTRGVSSFVTEAAKVENAVASFQPILGGVEQAKAAVDALNATAATTPFQFEQLADSAKTLLGFGAATQDTLIPTLRMLGDTAGGNAQRLNGIALAFSQIQAGGKATMQDINQLINNGVPILGELANMWGVTVGQAREMVSQGKATGDAVSAAFRNMTQEGGRFFNGMSIASATFDGKMSTLKDNIALTAASIGQALMPTLKPMIDRAIEIAGAVREWVTANQELIQQRLESFIQRTVTFARNLWDTLVALRPVLSGLVALWIGYNAALKVTAAIAIVQKIIAFTKAIQGAAAAQGIFNAIMAANPFGAIATAIGLVVAGLVWMALNWDKVTAAVQRFVEWIKPVGDFFNAVGDKLQQLFPNNTDYAAMGAERGENRYAPNAREAEVKASTQFDATMTFRNAPPMDISTQSSSPSRIRVEQMGMAQ